MQSPLESMDALLSPAELAQYLGTSTSSVYKLNHTKTGPQFFHIGQLVRYRISAVNEWLESLEK